ncbi:MAG: RNA methyltransferase [Candidatus Omnitrophota bacterium]
MEKAGRTDLKEIKELLREKLTRDEKNLFVAEGAKLAEDIACRKGLAVTVLISGSFNMKNPGFAEKMIKKDIRVILAGDRETEKICSLRSPEGVLMVARKPFVGMDARSLDPRGDILLLDNIQDPGNLGAMIRLAAAFGIKAVVLYGDCADEFNSKTVRASSGTILQVPVLRAGKEDIDELKRAGRTFLAGSASPDTSDDLGKTLGRPGAKIIAFGSEGKGLSGEIKERADVLFRIPMEKGVESLNVATAAAIALYEMRKGK